MKLDITKTFMIIASLLLVFSSASCKRESEADENKLMAGEFIATRTNSIPKIVLTDDNGFILRTCSGVLIENDFSSDDDKNENHLLTAAHCLFDKDGGLPLKLYPHNLNIEFIDPSGKLVTVPVESKENICYNQNYLPLNPTAKPYDLAIVKFSTPDSINLKKMAAFKTSSLQTLGALESPAPYAPYSAQGIGAGWGRHIVRETDYKFRFGAAYATTAPPSKLTGLLSGKAIWIDGDSGGPFIVRKGETPFSTITRKRNSDNIVEFLNTLDDFKKDYLNPEGSNRSTFAVTGIAVTYFEHGEFKGASKTYLIDLGSPSSRELIAAALTNTDISETCYNKNYFGTNFTYNPGEPLTEEILGKDIDGGGVTLSEIGNERLSEVPYIGYIGSGENFCNISAIADNSDKKWLVTAKHCLPSNNDNLAQSVLDFCSNFSIKGRLEGKVACFKNEANQFEFRILGSGNLENEDIIFIGAQQDPNTTENVFNSVIEISDPSITNISFVAYSAGGTSNEVKNLHGFIYNSNSSFGTPASAANDCPSNVLIHGKFDFSAGDAALQRCQISTSAHNAFYHPFNTEIGESGGVIFTKLGDNNLKVVCINIGRKGSFNYCIDFKLPPTQSLFTDATEATDPPEEEELPPPPAPPPPPPTNNPCLITGAVAAAADSNPTFNCGVTMCNLRAAPNTDSSNPPIGSITSADGPQNILACFNNTNIAERVWVCFNRPSGATWVFAGYNTSCEEMLR